MNDSAPRRSISELIGSRGDLIETFMIGVVLALGVSLIGAKIFAPLSTSATIIIGAVLTVATLTWFGYVRIRQTNTEFVIKGFLLYDRATMEFVEAPGYELTQDISTYQRAAFTERSDLFFQWLQDPLSQAMVPLSEGLRKDRSEENLAVQITRELLEYAVLERLGVHLTDYFPEKRFARKVLVEYDRANIPAVLLRNRILELFSRAPHDRPLFARYRLPEHTRLVMIVGGDTHYNDFSLRLPAKSQIDRTENGELVIRHPVLQFTVQIEFRGHGTHVPERFLEKFVRIPTEERDDISVLGMLVHVTLKARWRSIYSFRAWRYQLWVESFVASLNDRFGKDVFFAKLRWETIDALLGSLSDDAPSPRSRRWALEKYVGDGEKVEQPSLDSTWDRFLDDMALAIEGDRAARASVEAVMQDWSGTERDGLANALHRLLAGDQASVPTDLDPHAALVVQRTLGSLAQHRLAQRMYKLKVIVATAAAAQGVRAAREFVASVVERLAEDPSGRWLGRALHRIASGNWPVNVLDGLAPDDAALGQAALNRIHEETGRFWLVVPPYDATKQSSGPAWVPVVLQQADRDEEGQLVMTKIETADDGSGEVVAARDGRPLTFMLDMSLYKPPDKTEQLENEELVRMALLATPDGLVAIALDDEGRPTSSPETLAPRLADER